MLSACPPRDPAPSKESLEEYSRVLRDLESLREENRGLRKELRDREVAASETRKSLEALKTQVGELVSEGAARSREWTERIAVLQRELQTAVDASRPPEPGPGPEVIARLFLAAVRERDREALDSLSDWEGMLESALAEAAGGAEEAARVVREFRDLPEESRRDQARGAREEFLGLMLGERGPRFSSTPFWGDPAGGVLRYRATDARAGVTWDVLVKRSGDTWKVVGLVKQEPRIIETPSETGEGELPRERE